MMEKDFNYMEKMKFTKAPLPFQGQKRNSLKTIIPIIRDRIGSGKGWLVMDLFGGSGIISHHVKKYCPEAMVIYNDFDGYTQRISKIDKTKEIYAWIKSHLGDIAKESKIAPHTKEEILRYLSSHSEELDWVTISCWLSFSGNFYTCLEDFRRNRAFWNNLPKSFNPDVEDYLKDVSTICYDYKDLFSFIRKFEDKFKILVILDPPYLATNQEQYNSKAYFGTIDYLNIIYNLTDNFIFFGSDRSGIIGLFDWFIANDPRFYAKLSGYKVLSNAVSVNKDYSYMDYTIYKFKEDL